VCCLLVLVLRWAGSPLLLLTLVLLLMTRWVGGAVMVHHPVPRRSTAGCCCHILSLLCFLVGAERIIRDDGIADKLEE
jgi:hypothetical protein